MSKTSENRRSEVYQIILNEGRARVGDLARTLNVTTETIRKDLRVLEERGMLTKKHGSAVARNAYYQLPLDVKLQENTLKKQLIVQHAINMIPEEAIIYIDCGTTGLQLAKLIRSKRNITVLTNSLPMAEMLAESDVELIMIGGRLHKRGRSCTGFYATKLIDSIRIDMAFIGCDGFLNMDGPMTFSMEHAQINTHLLKQTKCSILMCDNSKFTKTSTYQFAKFSDFDVMITNDIDAKQKEAVAGVNELIIVKE